MITKTFTNTGIFVVKQHYLELKLTRHSKIKERWNLASRKEIKVLSDFKEEGSNTYCALIKIIFNNDDELTLKVDLKLYDEINSIPKNSEISGYEEFWLTREEWEKIDLMNEKCKAEKEKLREQSTAKFLVAILFFPFVYFSFNLILFFLGEKLHQSFGKNKTISDSFSLLDSPSLIITICLLSYPLTVYILTKIITFIRKRYCTYS